MEIQKPTLGIYAIQDRIDTVYPQLSHDHSIAFMENGEVNHFLQLERLSRIKRDNKLHVYLTDIIRKLKLVERDMDVVFVDNLVGRAFISTSGQIRFEAPLNKRLTKNWEEGKLWWFDHELNGFVLNHELAHVLSFLPFIGTCVENSLLIHFDGGASLSNFSAWMYRMDKIIPVEHHWELKHLTSLYNANALTFGIIGANIRDQNSVPGKLMGYTALGNYNEDIEFWLRQNKWFEDIWDKRSVFFEASKSDFNIELKSLDQHNTFLQDVAATIQEIFMRETLLKIDDLNSLSNCKNLYYTGGCALNIRTNSAIVESGLFDNIYIPPCAGDSGLALGAAAFGEWMKGNKIKKHTPFLNNWDIESNHFDYSSDDVAQAAQLLAEGEVIAVCNGYAEAGPRALGNRSLLALPTNALAKKASVELKQREWYRPVAPVMLEKNARYYTGLENIHPMSEFMLLDFQISKEKQNEIPGVVHANGTARIQTIFSKDKNPWLFDLLTLLNDQYNVKALINTSFNGKGEPIIHSYNDAFISAKKMGIAYVIINGKITKA
jgi:carbamoyltransferase